MAARITRHTARRRNRRRWRAATLLTPTVLMVAASSALLSMPPPTLRDGRADGVPGGSRYGATGHLPRNLEPSDNLLDLAGEPRKLPGPPADPPRGSLDIPEPMLAAYVGAADRLGQSHPACGVRWSVLAAIGRIESGHARDGRIDVNGITVPAILGPRLSGGPGVAAIPDTDQGSLDGDPVWDRAVGSMQFIPATWNKHAIDGNDDGVLSPHNVHDAVATAGAYLCEGDADLRDPRQLAEAVFRYNHSDEYVRTVLRWADAYDSGVIPSPLEPLPDAGDQDVLAGSRLPNDRPHAVALPHSASEPARPGSSAVSPPYDLPGGPSGAPVPGSSPDSAAGEPAGEPHAPNSPGSSANTPPAAGTSSAPGAPDEPSVPGSTGGSSAPGSPDAESPGEQTVPGFPGEPSLPELTGDPAAPSEPTPSEPFPSDPTTPSDPATQAPTGEPSAPESGTVPPVPSSEPPNSADPGSGQSSEPAAPPTATTVPEPPSARPPSSQPSKPTTPPSSRPIPDEPGAPSSTDPSPQRPESHETSSDFESSAPSTTADPAGLECDAATLREGRFVPAAQLAATGRALPAGTTDAGEASPGDIVYVQSGGSGPLDPCEVPADFAP